MSPHPLTLPPEDRGLSPHTGWTRAHWAAMADHLLLSLRPYASPALARFDLPGPHSVHGFDSDGLEGFARSFLLAAFRVAGENGSDPHGFLEHYRAGLVAGTDPDGPEPWPRPDELGQAKVEAASIALGLLLTRPWLWDRLSETEQGRVIAWMATVIGESYPPINWVWFQIVVEEFLRSVGGPWSTADIESGLAVHAGMRRAGGWLSDGAERSYDHYCGWALHFYPLVWAELAHTPPPEHLRERWSLDLRHFLRDYVHLIGGDGAPLFQGRSLTYRMASAAPLWVGAWSEATDAAPGLIRRAASGILRHFVDRGAPDAEGLLSLGWYGAWPRMKQAYSGGGSPYWAAKGFFGLLLPEDHPVWTAPEEPLPVEKGDFRRVVAAPGWILGGTVHDGIVRVINHGTDHGTEGLTVSDSPLYARLGYSTATAPPLVGEGLVSPLDNSVVVLDADGVATHRTGFVAHGVSDDGTAAVGHSSWRAHWIEPDTEGPDHGSGRRGRIRPGPLIDVWSVVRGADEVRVVRVGPDPAPNGAWRIRAGGWPVPRGRGPASSVQVLWADGRAETGTEVLVDVTPLSRETAVPRAVAEAEPGEVTVFLVRLSGGPVEPALRVTVDGDHAVITWSDGQKRVIPL